MVLESLISAKVAEKRPISLFPLGFIFGTVGIFLALWVFPSQSSLVMVFFTVIAVLPLMIRIITYEKNKEDECYSETEALMAHERAIPFFVFMFLGILAAYSIWFIVLPSDIVTTLFATQTLTIRQINTNISGHAIHSSSFGIILANNLKVLTFCILFSFIYGAGAIFILTWNASVIAAAIGNLSRGLISGLATVTGLTGVAGYFHAFSLGLMRYLVHGIPEMLAYFFGGLAGGVISVAIVRHEFGSEKFNMTMKDAFALTIIAIICLIIAAALEVGVTPLLPI